MGDREQAHGAVLGVVGLLANRGVDGTLKGKRGANYLWRLPLDFLHLVRYTYGSQFAAL